ncbi:MAG: S1C family serine protease [Erysipelotrichaceae bacterium]
MSKKIITALFALLVGWNVFLTYQFLTINTNTNENDQTIVDKEVANITTDLTELVANSSDKVVGIITSNNNQQYSTGSGIIYKVNEGLVTIVTNHHVIEGGNQYKVIFANGEELDASLIGSDELSDLAVLTLKVDFEVTPFALADSSLTKAGEYVIAIGSPLSIDYQGSTTFGVISAVDRSIAVDLNNDGNDDWDAIVLQTDAAINPGNSGGALVNLVGELVGITSMKITSTYDTTVEGIGFAIPANEVSSIVSQIEENGEVKRPLIGISGIGVSELSAREKSYYGISLDLESGIFVNEVTDAGAAQVAGLKQGDIITSLDGTTITTFKQFRAELYNRNVNDKVEIEVLRDGDTLTFEAVLQ